MRKLTVLVAAAMLGLAGCASTPKEDSAAVAQKAPSLSGDWVLTTTSQMGAQDADMKIVQDGNNISGSIATQMGTVDYKGTVTGSDVKFGFIFDAQGNTIPIDYSGTLQGETMSGAATFGDFGSGTWTAKRKQ